MLKSHHTKDITSPCVNWDFHQYDYEIIVFISFFFSPFEDEIHVAGEFQVVVTHKFHFGAKGRGITACNI